MKAGVRETVARYRPWPDLHYYARGKLALDPAYPAVAAALRDSPRPLLDLGCGMGLLASYLRARGHRAPILGMDLDERKVGVARQVVADATFLVQDALSLPEHSGDVVMLDVLHYFEDAGQQDLLAKVAASVAPGGVALIRLALNEPNWRFALTRLEEWFVCASRWISTSGWNFPSREEVSRQFEEAGLEGALQPMWGMTPFNSYLFTFRRSASSR